MKCGYPVHRVPDRTRCCAPRSGPRVPWACRVEKRHAQRADDREGRQHADASGGHLLHIWVRDSTRRASPRRDRPAGNRGDPRNRGTRSRQHHVLRRTPCARDDIAFSIGGPHHQAGLELLASMRDEGGVEAVLTVPIAESHIAKELARVGDLDGAVALAESALERLDGSGESTWTALATSTWWRRLLSAAMTEISSTRNRR